MPHTAGHGEKRGDGRYIPTHLSVCSSVKGLLIGNCFLHIWMGMVQSAEHNWILGTRRVFLKPVTSAAMQCLCCYDRRPEEANAFHLIPQ